MIVGRYDFGRPTIDCHITIKSLNIDGVVPFLADTGCDRTTLMPFDSVPLKIPFDQLTNQRTAYGFGGGGKVFFIPAILVVSDKTTLYGYRFAIDIAEPTDALEGMPSLLGRDIMQNWKMNFDFPEHKLTFEIQTCDEELPR
jgi:hypothetical protein